jgi:hypothetical protein
MSDERVRVAQHQLHRVREVVTVLGVALVVGALVFLTLTVYASIGDQAITACRTEQRAAVDQAISDNFASTALLTRIRTEYDIAKALGQNPDLAPFVERAQDALADIDDAVARQDRATDAYQRGARLSRTNPDAFLRECRR